MKSVKEDSKGESKGRRFSRKRKSEDSRVSSPEAKKPAEKDETDGGVRKLSCMLVRDFVLALAEAERAKMRADFDEQIQRQKQQNEMSIEAFFQQMVVEGYSGSKEIIVTALTDCVCLYHSQANKKLEFLGDALANFLVTYHLMVNGFAVGFIEREFTGQRMHTIANTKIPNFVDLIISCKSEKLEKIPNIDALATSDQGNYVESLLAAFYVDNETNGFSFVQKILHQWWNYSLPCACCSNITQLPNEATPDTVGSNTVHPKDYVFVKTILKNDRRSRNQYKAIGFRFIRFVLAEVAYYTIETATDSHKYVTRGDAFTKKLSIKKFVEIEGKTVYLTFSIRQLIGAICMDCDDFGTAKNIVLRFLHEEGFRSIQHT